jgi:hypothetical protein
MNNQSDIQTIFPGKEVKISGETVTVKPFTFGQLPKVMKLLNKLSGPILASQSAGEAIDTTMLFGLLAEGSDDLVSLISASSGLSVQTINLLQQDEGIELLAAFIEVNGSFFVQRVLPLIKTLVEKQVAGFK